eukprot:1358186-Amorphochlora_amoeboformis.AAC.1
MPEKKFEDSFLSALTILRSHTTTIYTQHQNEEKNEQIPTQTNVHTIRTLSMGTLGAFRAAGGAGILVVFSDCGRVQD